MKIAIGNDHAGTSYKQKLVAYLKEAGHEITNHGTDEEDSVDYPDFIHPVAENVSSGETTYGIIICGSGNGANMVANSHKGIRSALCWYPELAKLARSHNNANVLSIPARFVSYYQALDMVKAFLDTPFEGGRHQRRVEKIDR